MNGLILHHQYHRSHISHMQLDCFHHLVCMESLFTIFIVPPVGWTVPLRELLIPNFTHLSYANRSGLWFNNYPQHPARVNPFTTTSHRWRRCQAAPVVQISVRLPCSICYHFLPLCCFISYLLYLPSLYILPSFFPDLRSLFLRHCEDLRNKIIAHLGRAITRDFKEITKKHVRKK